MIGKLINLPIAKVELLAAIAVVKVAVSKPLEPSLRVGRGRRADNVPAAPLAAEIRVFLERSGMTIAAFGRAVLGAKTGFYRLLKPGATVTAETARRINAFIAEYPCAEASPPESGDRTAKSAAAPVAQSPPPQAPDDTAAALVAEILAFCAERSITPSRFGRAVLNGPKIAERLKSVKTPKPKTIARIRAAIADPPDSLIGLAPLPARQTRAQRDGTAPPDTPDLDGGETIRRKAAQNGASIRRSQEREAAKLVDAGVAPGAAKNSFQAALMRNIERRRADEARLADPLEQAKLVLQRKGRVVHSAAVTGGRKDRFIVSGCRREISAKELQALAGGSTTFMAINEGVDATGAAP